MGDIILFENFNNKKLYRGISKQELIKACKNDGRLIFTSADGLVSLTDDIKMAKNFSNYVVEVESDIVSKVGMKEYKSKSPKDCQIILIHEFNTKGSKIGTYSIDEFLNLL